MHATVAAIHAVMQPRHLMAWDTARESSEGEEGVTALPGPEEEGQLLLVLQGLVLVAALRLPV